MPNDDLISRKALLENYDLKNATKYGNKTEEQRHNSYSTLMRYEIADMIMDAPAVDAEPVKYGKWRKTCSRNGKIDLWPPTYECSECNNILFGSPRTNYCPNCGAKMEENE